MEDTAICLFKNQKTCETWCKYLQKIRVRGSLLMVKPIEWGFFLDLFMVQNGIELKHFLLYGCTLETVVFVADILYIQSSYTAD